MHSAVNVKHGKKEERPLLYVLLYAPPPRLYRHLPVSRNGRTGVHTVQDVFCMGCNDRVGWYYMKASDPSQKYKEGAY